VGDKTDTGSHVWIAKRCGQLKENATYANVFQSRFNLSSSVKEDASDEKSCKPIIQTVDDDDEVFWLHLSCPCFVEDPKIGVCTSGKGKFAETAFAVVNYDKQTDTTIVVAKPVTG